ncbi:hypothetical protein PTSG_01710 [Salpingoeca rosetta]|uniref:SAM domain-containing protein n=1 Tax=Salpingoeca rosetta (strain ATCC 50818 / BSB-021) TaxID=946362 RepID=F2TYQ6_SALR5|nr:uncharacterized protein PTSG_01710 [Salpingoeca rosetta]EGD78730.1 hypothetical protein PTSG_01710 [Salpingoeca rosetta]|eukprot:XP_004997687.1 hypothetical protein PTSG_01710 [Salpingoeca rosetta]
MPKHSTSSSTATAATQRSSDRDAIRRLSEERRVELMHAVRDGRVTVDSATQEIYASSSSSSSPHLRQRVDLDELQHMGDWAQLDTFEWDATDITLSTDEGLRWLQSLGIVSHKYRVEDLSATQKDAVNRLLTKLHQKHQPFADPSLTAVAIEKDETIKENVQEVMNLLPPKDHQRQHEEQARSSDSDSHEGDGAFSDTQHSPRRPKHKVTPQKIADVTQRLSMAWAHALESKRANKQLEKETATLLLMSRARLQAEIIALRRENEALRAQVEPSQVMQALQAEKALTAELQELLDQRDSEIMYLSHELSLKNDELAVLRSARDLSSSWYDSRRSSRRPSAQTSMISGPVSRNATPEKRQSGHHALLSRRERLDDLLDKHGVPRTGRRDMWAGATKAAEKEKAREERHRRLEVNNGSPLPSQFVI